jgi:hypothetical protein
MMGCLSLTGRHYQLCHLDGHHVQTQSQRNHRTYTPRNH